MLAIKWAAIALMCALAIVQGGMAAAWRRACIHITQQVLGATINSQAVDQFTPRFVAQRNNWAVLLLFLAALLTWFLFTWKAALLVLVITYTLIELSGFVYPRPTSPYYAQQIMADLQMWVQIHTRFGNTAEAQNARSRLELLESAVRAAASGPAAPLQTR
jgi:hypothetical protein